MAAREARSGSPLHGPPSSDTSGLGTPPALGRFFADIWPHAKSRQGFPRRLVPLRLRRGTVSSGARTQPVLALIWTHATFNEAGGCVASVSENSKTPLTALRCRVSLYKKSQAHAGWTLSRSRYDDGGYLGGSTDRPDLQKLLDDKRRNFIEAIPFPIKFIREFRLVLPCFATARKARKAA
jgi:hypothetical protein